MSLHHWLWFDLRIPGASFQQSLHKLWTVAFVLTDIAESPCRDGRDDGKEDQKCSNNAHDVRRHLATEVESIGGPIQVQLIPKRAAAGLNNSQPSATQVPLMMEVPQGCRLPSPSPGKFDSFLICDNGILATCNQAASIRGVMTPYSTDTHDTRSGMARALIPD